MELTGIPGLLAAYGMGLMLLGIGLMATGLGAASCYVFYDLWKNLYRSEP